MVCAILGRDFRTRSQGLGPLMRWLAAFVTAFLAVCLANQPALAGKRVALVIGNSSYQNVAALTNPANDATAITEMFKKASFDVVESRHLPCDRRTARQCLQHENESSVSAAAGNWRYRHS